MVYPDLIDFKIVDRRPDADARDRAFEIAERLDKIDFAEVGAVPNTFTQSRPPTFRFTADAQEFFYGWLTDLETKIRSHDTSAALASHLAKYRGLLPKLAMQFHVLDVLDGRPPGPVGIESALMASAWCKHLEAHARRVYALVGDRDMNAAQRLGERIKRGDLPSPFKARDLVRKRWSGLDQADTVEQALAVLVEHGWLYELEKPSGERGGRPTADYHVNPRIASAPAGS